MTSALGQLLIDALAEASPRAQDLLISQCERRALTYLTRLLARARREGPDGEVLKNDADINALEATIDILREIKL